LKYVQNILFIIYFFTSSLARSHMSMFNEFHIMSKTYVTLAEQGE